MDRKMMEILAIVLSNQRQMIKVQKGLLEEIGRLQEEVFNLSIKLIELTGEGRAPEIPGQF